MKKAEYVEQFVLKSHQSFGLVCDNIIHTDFSTLDTYEYQMHASTTNFQSI